MKKANIKGDILNATSSLVDMVTDNCWNIVSENHQYIMSEIDDNIDISIYKQNKIRKKINTKKIPKSLTEIVSDLKQIYENLYDVNLYIYNSSQNKTLIEIRYYLKTSLTSDFYSTVKNNEPMLHCKIARPFYVTRHPNSTKSENKFDVNWQLNGFRHKLNSFLGRNRYYWWRFIHLKNKRKKLNMNE